MTRCCRTTVRRLSFTLAILSCLGFQAGSAEAAAPHNGRMLGLRSGQLDTRREANEWPAVRRSPTRGGRYVVQLDGPINSERRSRLAAAGVALGDYLPENAYVVTLDQADAGALAKLDFVRWAGKFRKAWKLDPSLGRRSFETPERKAMAARGEMAVEISMFADVPAAGAVAAIEALNGGAVHWITSIGGQEVISATVRAADAAKLADLQDVQFVEEASELTLRNGTNRWIVQSNQSGVYPLYNHGIHGEGQVIGIIDSSVDRNHCAFTDTDPIGPLHRKIEAYNTGFGVSTHGTHVAGICVGDNFGEDNNRGIAYLARLVYNSIPSFTEDAVKSRLEVHHNQGARIHTNSWGDDGTTAYNSMARGIDVFSYEHEDDLVLFAVTNTSLLKNPENAKNLLAVGASQDSPNQGNLCFGGAGPTNDGRRKPEIFAPGCSTNSASAGTSCGTTTLSGTSMACPAVAAAGLLARQYFTDGFYPTGAAVPADGFTPSGALIKAVLLNSAVDMSGLAGYPSNQEGWGRVLLDNALYFPNDASRLFADDIRNADGLSADQRRPYVFSVQGGATLRVTLAWTDPPASVNANPASVNDLDLEVHGPGDVEYMGNVFSGGQSITGGARDSKNNVEQVQLALPAAGDYTVWVRAVVVSQGPLVPPQEPFTQGYAIVVTGNAVQVSDCNVNGFADGTDIASGVSNDCQANAVPDECDLAAGTSVDANANNVPDECDPPPPPNATVTSATSWKLHAVRGPQFLTLNHAARVEDGNVSSEGREGGITELRIGFDTALSAGVVTLAAGAVTLEQQRTGDPNAGTSAGYTAPTYAGTISTAASSGSELVLVFTPALQNATTYRVNIGAQVTSLAGQSVEVRGLHGDVDDSGAVNATDRSIVVGIWTGAAYTTRSDIDLSGATSGGDRSAVIAAWTGAENSAP